MYSEISLLHYAYKINYIFRRYQWCYYHPLQVTLEKWRYILAEPLLLRARPNCLWLNVLFIKHIISIYIVTSSSPPGAPYSCDMKDITDLNGRSIMIWWPFGCPLGVLTAPNVLMAPRCTNISPRQANLCPNITCNKSIIITKFLHLEDLEK